MPALGTISAESWMAAASWTIGILGIQDRFDIDDAAVPVGEEWQGLDGTSAGRGARQRESTHSIIVLATETEDARFGEIVREVAQLQDERAVVGNFELPVLQGHLQVAHESRL